MRFVIGYAKEISGRAGGRDSIVASNKKMKRLSYSIEQEVERLMSGHAGADTATWSRGLQAIASLKAAPPPQAAADGGARLGALAVVGTALVTLLFA